MMQMLQLKNIWPVRMRRAFPVIAALFFLLSTSVAAGAEPKQPAKTDRPYLTAPAVRSLQEKLMQKRPRAPILVAIPLAYRYGNDPQSYYCSPSIRVTNSSNSPVQEIIVGIAFRQRPGRDVGRSITRIVDIDIGAQETHFFYQLDTDNCFGVSGEVSVIRCVYENGEECVSDVRASQFGTIPLTLKMTP